MAPMPESAPPPAQGPADTTPGPSSRQAYRAGITQAVPFLVVIVPFSMLFGVVATEAGFDIAEVMGFSIVVLAGASQFTAVQLMSDHVPAILVILSALAVNLRMAMYSASLMPWLGAARGWQKVIISYALIDQTYALSIDQFERHPAWGTPQRVAYFFGSATLLCVPWSVGTFLGATVGDAIPPGIALDFALPITFLAMFAPMLRTVAHLAACATAIVAALLLAWMPSGTGLLIAAPLGMAVGALVEARFGFAARADGTRPDSPRDERAAP